MSSIGDGKRNLMEPLTIAENKATSFVYIKVLFGAVVAMVGDLSEIVASLTYGEIFFFERFQLDHRMTLHFGFCRDAKLRPVDIACRSHLVERLLRN